ncbi:MAG: phosphoribosylaminoimidazolesuccinocarboxamide synthase [Candidatus Thermoplasmatota archaeon]
MRLCKRGKVKEVYEVGDDELEFLFTDQVSVFDKIVPTRIPFKGETLCRTAAYWFKEAERLGVRTHFLHLSAPNRMRVRRVKVPEMGEALSPAAGGYLIPLEVIARYYVAGSLHDRLRSGVLSPRILGFRALPPYGARLPEPFIETTTKLEKVDRLLSEEEAMRLAGLTREDLRQIREVVLEIDRMIASRVRARGLMHVDGKKEFGFDAERNLILVDTFGTADEDRFWDLERYEAGECVEVSKERVRAHYRSTGYYDALRAARERGKAEPAILPLPDEMVREVSELYVSLFERITGEQFR